MTAKLPEAANPNFSMPDNRVSTEADPLHGSAQDYDTIYGEYTHRQAVLDHEDL